MGLFLHFSISYSLYIEFVYIYISSQKRLFYEYILSAMYETFWNFINAVAKLECQDRVGKICDKSGNVYRNYNI